MNSEQLIEVDRAGTIIGTIDHDKLNPNGIYAAVLGLFQIEQIPGIILFQRGKDSRDMQGFWALLSGFMNTLDLQPKDQVNGLVSNESALAALQREAQEELAWPLAHARKIDVLQRLLIPQGQGKYQLYFFLIHIQISSSEYEGIQKSVMRLASCSKKRAEIISVRHFTRVEFDQEPNLGHALRTYRHVFSEFLKD